MNWTHRRPFRNQLNYGGGMNKASMNRPLTYHHVSKTRSDQPIDAIRLQLADYEPPCPIHHPVHRYNPYVTTFSDQQSSTRRPRSSVHSISTVETDFVHQRVSTIHTYPTSPSIVERQEIIDEPILAIEHQSNNDNNNESIQEESKQCRTCTMLIDIVDQQTQQIRQYAEQIAQQADLLAKLARRIAGIEEEIEEQKSDNNTEPPTTDEHVHILGEK